MTNEPRPATKEVARYALAVEDMRDVSKAARIIADHDPDLNPLGPKPHASGLNLAEAQARALERRSFSRHEVLGDPYVRSVLETGLIVTYARPFTEGRGSGFPLQESFVPRDKRELHKRMLELRKQVHAHIDADGPEGFRRTVEQSEGPGVRSVHLRGPRRLGEHELRALADLADEIREALEAARDKAQEATSESKP